MTNSNKLADALRAMIELVPDYFGCVKAGAVRAIAEKALAEHDAQPAQGDWQPIASAPKWAFGMHPSYVLIGHETARWVFVGYRHDPNYPGDPEWCDEHGEFVSPQPTHWMPLPAAPGEAPQPAPAPVQVDGDYWIDSDTYDSGIAISNSSHGACVVVFPSESHDNEEVAQRIVNMLNEPPPAPAADGAGELQDKDIRPGGGWLTPYRREPTDTSPWQVSLFTAQQVQTMIAADRAAIAALRQPVPDAARLRAKPLRWTEAGLPRTSGWKEWSEALMDYHIIFDPEEEPEDRYTAACGEGEPERFATLEEAKKWCQADADEWVQKIALASQQESRNAD